MIRLRPDEALAQDAAAATEQRTWADWMRRVARTATATVARRRAK
jgi:hypothetical protein